MLLNSLNPYTYLFFVVVHYLCLVNSYLVNKINQISEIHP